MVVCAKVVRRAQEGPLTGCSHGEREYSLDRPTSELVPGRGKRARPIYLLALHVAEHGALSVVITREYIRSRVSPLYPSAFGAPAREAVRAVDLPKTYAGGAGQRCRLARVHRIVPQRQQML